MFNAMICFVHTVQGCLRKLFAGLGCFRAGLSHHRITRVSFKLERARTALDGAGLGNHGFTRASFGRGTARTVLHCIGLSRDYTGLSVRDTAYTVSGQGKAKTHFCTVARTVHV